MYNVMEPAATGIDCAVHIDIMPEIWKFCLGQCISHKDMAMPSLVLGRVRTSRGDEIYSVRSFAIVDPNRDRMMMGEALIDVSPGDKPCHDCLLYMTGMCPGAKR